MNLQSLTSSSWISLKGLKVSATNTLELTTSFEKALKVWVWKPHVVNQRLFAAKILSNDQFSTKQDALEFMKKQPLKYGDISVLEKTGELTIPASEVLKDFDTFTNDFVVVMRLLLPKSTKIYNHMFEAVFIDRTTNEATFFPILPRKLDTQHSCSDIEDKARKLGARYPSISFVYKFKLKISDVGVSEIEVYILSCERKPENEPTEKWLCDVLLMKITKWSMEEVDGNLATKTSLQLVCSMLYNQLYHQLKDKYAAVLVDNWKESTDAKKFVYEDIGIATYLILMWEDEQRQLKFDVKQSFVDLGCGNGLLVYILCSEGYRGLGLDIRKRKIWDTYPPLPQMKLEEKNITPSDESLFPEYNWLIGNHSDELTPWIPVIAAKSSFTTRFLVLPCCPHDFDKKFNKKVSGESQYRTYLNFVKKVGQTCGFVMEEDALRIPSTKRICFIGKSRTYEKSEEEAIYTDIHDLIASQCDGMDMAVNNDSSWSKKFQVRGEEKVRNCTQVDLVVRENIITTVFTAIMKADQEQSIETETGQIWHTGGTVPLTDVSQMFARDTLTELKSQHGGIQTLLRNQFQIFEVRGGVVKLRNWSQENPCSRYKKPRKDSRDFIKTKLCWFHDHHPDGCPLTLEKCQFAHGIQDMKKT